MNTLNNIVSLKDRTPKAPRGFIKPAPDPDWPNDTINYWDGPRRFLSNPSPLTPDVASAYDPKFGFLVHIGSEQLSLPQARGLLEALAEVLGEVEMSAAEYEQAATE